MQTIYVNVQCRLNANKECYSCSIICDWLFFSFPGILIVITSITLNYLVFPFFIGSISYVISDQICVLVPLD